MTPAPTFEGPEHDGARDQADPAGAAPGGAGHGSAGARAADLDTRAGSPRSAAAARLHPHPVEGVAAHPLDRLADLAARLLGAPSAQLSLTSDVQLVAGSAGAADGTSGSRSAVEDSLCTVTAASGAPLVVGDAAGDERVLHLPQVTSGEVRAYLGAPLTDAGGHTVGALCVFAPQPRAWSAGDVEVLEQLAAAAMAEMELSALSRDHQRDRLALDLAVAAARIGIWDLDLVTGTRSWDDRMLEIFGVAREGFDARVDAVGDSVHPEDRERVRAAVDRAVEEAGHFEVDHRVLLPDGSTRWVSTHGSALTDGDGRAVRVIGAAHDVTAVRTEQARTAEVLESMAVGYLSMDGGWRITYVNAQAVRALGRPRDELVGGVIWDLFPATVGTDFEVGYRRAAESGQVVSFDAYYPAPLNAWYEVRATPETGGLALYFLDITARHEAQEATQVAALRLSGLALAALALLDAEDVGDLITVIAERGLAGVGADGGAVALLDPDDPALLRSYVTASYGRGAQAEYAELAVSTALPVCEAATTGRRVLLADRAACVAYSAPMRDVVTSTGSQAFASLPLRADGRVVGVLTAGWDAPQTFSAEQLDLLDTFAAQCAQALQRQRARDRERASTAAALQAAAQQAALVAIAQALGSAETETDVLEVIARHGITLLDASGCGLFLREPDGTHLRTLTTDTFSADLRQRVERLPVDLPLPVVHAATTGTAHFLPDRPTTQTRFHGAEELYEAAGTQASASVPLHAHGQLLGALSMAFADARTWTEVERDLVSAFAALTAQALDRIAAREDERAASAAASRFSETLQRSFLTDPPAPDHLQIAVRYSPAAAHAQVGGDWYDAFMTEDGTTSLVIGDVIGHDMHAAAVMGQLRNLLRGIGHAIGEPPAAVLSALDRAMHDLAVATVATAVIAQVEQPGRHRAAGTRVLRWSNAGHPAPLLISSDGSTRYLQERSDLLLGIDPRAPRHDHEEVLQPGDTVLLYTDGLVERRGEGLQPGLEWLAGAAADLADLRLEELCDALLELVGGELEDDVALLALRAHPEDAPRPPEAGPSWAPADAPALLLADDDVPPDEPPGS